MCPHAPHGPYFPASKHADEFERKPLRDVASLHEKSLADKPDWVSGEAPYTRKERTAYSKEYRGMLRELQEVDDMVARIMSALADTNQRANTYIFFLTDNGYLLGEHGLHYKNTPYEEASRTPFIVRGPGVKNGIHSHVMVSHIDSLQRCWTSPALRGPIWTGVRYATCSSMKTGGLQGGATRSSWRTSSAGGTCSGRPSMPTWSGTMGRRNSTICTLTPTSCEASTPSRPRLISSASSPLGFLR